MEIKGNVVKEMHGKEIFVFVHGAWAGGWVWDYVAPFLQRLGHQTIAVDLPGHGNDPADISTQTGETYAKKVIQIICNLDRQVILVGNSMGGSVISRIGEAIPLRIKKIVYIAAFLLQDGESGNGIDGHGIQPVDWLRESEDGKTVRKHVGTIPPGLRPDQVEAAKEREFKRAPRESIAALSGPVHVTKEK